MKNEYEEILKEQKITVACGDFSATETKAIFHCINESVISESNLAPFKEQTNDDFKTCRKAPVCLLFGF